MLTGQIFGRKLRPELGVPIWPPEPYMEHLYHIRTSQKKKNKKNSKKLGPLLGTPDMLGLLYNNMAIGRIRKSKKSFGSVMRSAPAMAPGVPPAYPLNFYNHSFLGVPLYHFRSDWKTSAGLRFRDIRP